MSTADNRGHGSDPAGGADDTVAVSASTAADCSSRPVPAAGVASAAGATGSALVFDDPLDRASADDTDLGWGEPSSGAGEDDFTRFLNEKPPHHL